MTPPEEKTEKESKVELNREPGSETKQSLVKLEVSEVEAAPKTPHEVFVNLQNTQNKTSFQKDHFTHVKPESPYKTPPETSWKIWQGFVTKQMESIKHWTQDLFANLNAEKSENVTWLPLVESFGPTLLVGFIFFVWAIYDHTQRPHIDVRDLQSHAFVEQAMEELAKGNKTQTKILLTEALRHSTNPEQIERLQEILNQIK